MAPDGTLPAEIPDPWRQTVVRILRQAINQNIQIRVQARIDWEQTFPEATKYDRFEAMADALDEGSVLGRKIEGMDEKGEVYAFWFRFDTRQLYGKINLLPSRDKILIYSSHLPRKGDQL